MRKILQKTTVGESTVMSLKTFLRDIVPNCKTSQDYITYHKHISGPRFFFTEGPENLPSFKHEVAFLHKPSTEYHKMHLESLAEYVEIEEGLTGSASLESLAISAIERYIGPKYIVSLGHRKYLAVDADSLVMYTNDKGEQALILTGRAVWGRIPFLEENVKKRCGKYPHEILGMINSGVELDVDVKAFLKYTGKGYSYSK